MAGRAHFGMVLLRLDLCAVKLPLRNLLLSGCLLLPAWPAASAPADLPVAATSPGSASLAEAGGAAGAAPWRFYAAPRNEVAVDRFLPLQRTAFGVRPAKNPSPSLTWQSAAGGRTVAEIRPERDETDGCFVAAWTTPTAGDWAVDLAVCNPGTDVVGGDGGYLILSYLPAGATLDTAVFASLAIAPSARPAPRANLRKIVRLQAGDQILLKVASGIDGYGDRFQTDLRFIRTSERGETVAWHGLDGLLPQPPAQRRAAGAPLADGRFWLVSDGGWLTDPRGFAAESYALVRKYVPALAAGGVVSFPDQLPPLPAWFADHRMPVLAQTWGAGYEPYMKAAGAFEIDAQGRDLGRPDPNIPLSGSAHAAALPHPATWTAFERYGSAAIRSGYSGFSFIDMVWMWGAGRGTAGYNPATLQAFRRDLLGTDDGLTLAWGGRDRKTMKFADYATFYFGGLPTPRQLGFGGWDRYQPPTAQQAANPGRYPAESLLFDLLCHYEWLKLAEQQGRVAAREGGFFQCMPNPEDLANGCDLLAAAALPSVNLLTEEFFNSPNFLDGAYTRWDRFKQQRPAGTQLGVVMELGGGGNGWPYYAPEIAYATAYELSLATAADHFECDFWPSERQPLAQAIQNPNYLARYRGALAYGLGFTHAEEDAARRLPADFLSVTSRRIFRPWGSNWLPWTQQLGNEGSPDALLLAAGYSFEGAGEEILGTPGAIPRVVLYSPSLPTELGLRRLLKLVADGKITHAIVPASVLDRVFTSRFTLEPVAKRFPELRGWNAAQKPGTGQSPQETALVIGRGTLHVLRLDPADPGQASVARELYGRLLTRAGIHPKWHGADAVTVRLYRNAELLVAGAHTRAVRDWNAPADAKPEAAYRPYHVPESTDFTVTMEAGREYRWLALPSGRRGAAKAGPDGALRLELKRTSHELFFILPADAADTDTRLARLAQRPPVLARSMTLNGLAP